MHILLVRSGLFWRSGLRWAFYSLLSATVEFMEPRSAILRAQLVGLRHVIVGWHPLIPFFLFKGSSGGAIAGSALFFDVDLDALMEYVVTCVEEVRRAHQRSQKLFSSQPVQLPPPG